MVLGEIHLQETWQPDGPTGTILILVDLYILEGEKNFGMKIANFSQSLYKLHVIDYKWMLYA